MLALEIREQAGHRVALQPVLRPAQIARDDRELAVARVARDIPLEFVAAIEGGRFGFAFASGMAAIDATLRLVKAGEHVVVSSMVGYAPVEKAVTVVAGGTVNVDWWMI